MASTPRVDRTVAAAKVAGLIPQSHKDAKVSGRVHRVLLEAAKQRAGLTCETALLEYALAKVALEDDFGDLFVPFRGTVDRDIELVF